MSDTITRQSKFLSYVLRHRPDEIGLKLDENGWASVDELLELAVSTKKCSDLDRKNLEEIVRTCAKRRYALSPDGLRIRANQGHSVKIDLGLEPRKPPAVLYHGTATRFLSSILRDGLRPKSRTHVHLSFDRATAVEVGKRHGVPVVLEVDSEQMFEKGHEFMLAENGVWLTSAVPPEYITPP